ncbi:hypothetical protein HDG38_001756 [Paraburkholderia sp. WSM4177]|nr:hypothetical protein [Paraburkholderia sp. WSM4177]MBB5483248.1 hypothetical protein [Paraburkholderia sp. WSM4180]
MFLGAYFQVCDTARELGEFPRLRFGMRDVHALWPRQAVDTMMKPTETTRAGLWMSYRRHRLYRQAGRQARKQTLTKRYPSCCKKTNVSGFRVAVMAIRKFLEGVMHFC